MKCFTPFYFISLFMNKCPEEIYRKIYQYLNPVSKLSPIKICEKSWCHVCGEYILKDDISVQKPILSKPGKCKYLCLDCFNLKLDI